jgi:hypothetical protein
MSFIKKYSQYIIIILLALFLLKNCQSCNKQRQLDYTIYNYEIVLDSMQFLNDKYMLENRDLRDSIGLYKLEVKMLNDKVDILKGSNKHYQQTNRILVNTNKNLSNKE